MTFRSVLFSRRSSALPSTRPSLTLFFLLAGAFLLTLVPHVVQFPIWLSVLIILAMIVRSIMEVYQLPMPSTTFCGIMAVLLLGAIFAQFSMISGREAGTAFTAGLLAIKFFEIRRSRDVSLIIFSCFFVVMSALLYSQVLELFIYCLIMMWVLTALLLRVHTGDLPDDRLLRMLRQSGIVFLQAIPFALFLFFFFPRYQGTLGFTLDQNSIGLTDTVAPGTIAALSQNDSEAMYVRFLSGTTPVADMVYWRALVLWNYENGAWTPGQISYTDPATKPSGADTVLQEVTIRRNNQKWLCALDAPIGAADNSAESPSWSKILNGNVLQMTSGRLDHTARYRVFSSPFLADEPLGERERSGALRLPLNEIDPRVQALADQLHHGLSKDQVQEYVHAVLHYFRHEGFVGSMEPGIQGKNWLPVFLFQTKKGFCEHYASAFAILMRLEGVPARLVAGYQGATYNPYADTFVVLQSNAHAWDEVWINAKIQPIAGETEGHWVRVDPTAILSATEENAAAGGPGNPDETVSIQIAQHKLRFSEAYLPTWLKSGLDDLRLRREEVETQWDNLLFAYDPETQERLSQALGLGRQAWIILLLSCIVAGGACVVIFRKWMTRRIAISPVENLYAAFCRNMARRGIPRATWEGPFAYTERVAEAFPDDKLVIQRVGTIVAHARYGSRPAEISALHDLKSLLTAITASQAASPSRERP
jgi:transglutaminase-like putative cysteine protease